MKIAYGGINAVKGIDLVVHEGEMVALIGANGAGKTSTLEGDQRHPVAGQRAASCIAATDVIGCPAYTLVERGLALVPEGRQVFGRLTVQENLRMGAYARRDGAQVEDRPGARSTSCFRACTSGARRPEVRCPAASSRCSRSGVH